MTSKLSTQLVIENIDVEFELRNTISEYENEILYETNQSEITKLQNLKFATVKLNNFLGYTKAAQLDYIGVNLDESDWKINSTNTLL